MPDHHPPSYEFYEHAQNAEHERQQEEFVARKSYELYKEVSQEAEQEATRLLDPIPSFKTGKLDDPEDIQRLNNALAKATAHLRSHERVKRLIEEGASSEALRNTPKMLLEFNSMIQTYRTRLADFRDKIPQMILTLERERDRQGISGIALLKVNSKITQLKDIIPYLEQKLTQSMKERDRLLSEYSEAVQETAIFRIKLARMLNALDAALKEGRAQTVMICMCCVRIAINLHKQPLDIQVDEKNRKFQVLQAKPEQDSERNEWDGVRRIREAQSRLRIMDRVISSKPQTIGEGDDAVFT